jgi:putative transposase
MPDYGKGGHTVDDLQYHVVWATKYRYHVLRAEVAERTRDLIRQVWMSRDRTIVKGQVRVDHGHRLVSCPPLLSPAKIIQSIKGVSSRQLQEAFSPLQKRYWGQPLWARGYFCATVGTVTQEQIQEYIDHHERPSPDDPFHIDT